MSDNVAKNDVAVLQVLVYANLASYKYIPIFVQVVVQCAKCSESSILFCE